jgi:hypothetical protein
MWCDCPTQAVLRAANRQAGKKNISHGASGLHDSRSRQHHFNSQSVFFLILSQYGHITNRLSPMLNCTEVLPSEHKASNPCTGKKSGGFLMSTLQGSIGDTHEKPNAFNKTNLVLSPEV